MVIDDRLYVGHAAVTDFPVVLVEDFVEYMLAWKVLLDQFEEKFVSSMLLRCKVLIDGISRTATPF